VAILSLAIGIGANTGIYSIYSTIFHSVRGVENPKDLVLVDPGGNRDAQTSYPEYLDYRDQTTEVFTDLVAYKPNLALLSRGEQSEMILIEEVSGNYFDMLGVTPALGRVLIAKEDDRPQSAPVEVLNHFCWQRKFGGDAGILGKTVKLNGHPFTVVGVTQSDFQGMFPFHVDLWAPIHQHPLLASAKDDLMSRDRSDWFMMGRLRAGFSLSQARALVRTIGSRLAAANPGNRRVGTGTVLPKSQLAIIMHSFLHRCFPWARALPSVFFPPGGQRILTWLPWSTRHLQKGSGPARNRWASNSACKRIRMQSPIR
jgi:hypothetical protein